MATLERSVGPTADNRGDGQGVRTAPVNGHSLSVLRKEGGIGRTAIAAALLFANMPKQRDSILANNTRNIA